MNVLMNRFSRFTEIVAALMVAAMFGTFILQIFVRYSARSEWVAETLPFLDPALYNWTLELCLLLWVWLIFWGGAFVVRDRDHVTFDILINTFNARSRRTFTILGGVIMFIALATSIYPTWDKFDILRLKRTATLSNLFGDWIRMRDIYYIYIMFLIVVALRYALSVYLAVFKYPPREDQK
ncbi:TRAP transporter small permease subunit [Rhodobacteraceae bacterium XHP0102]|nr:TRAP transporter small permease subunit [Rhodobacteraceae bacterium XHP0102]